MNRSAYSRLFFFVVLIATSVILPKIAAAQWQIPKISISGKLRVADQTIAKVGLIVAKDTKEYYLPRRAEEKYVAGVITEDSDLLYTYDNPESYATIATSGVTNVWVSNKNGAIHQGDGITTSTEPGIGMKSDNATVVFGYALESVSDTQKEPVLIKMQLDLPYSRSLGSTTVEINNQAKNTASILLSGFQFEAQQRYSRAILYLVIIIVVIIANVLGFIVFGRIAVSGIYSIGRNPLAKKTIVNTILINAVMVMVFTIGTIAVALLILRLQ